MRQRWLKAFYASLIVAGIATFAGSLDFNLDGKEMQVGFSLSTDAALRDFGLYLVLGFCASLLTLKLLDVKR